MNHKTADNKYDFKVITKDFRPSKENPEKIIVKIETSLPIGNGEQKIFETNKVFKPEQVSSGRWKEHVRKWIDNMCQNCQQETPNMEDGVHNAKN